MAEHDQSVEAGEVLARLAAKAMLSFDARTGRYELPAEVASFIRQAGDQSTRLEAEASLVAWARGWAEAAASFERTGNESQVLDEFAGQHPHLEKAAALDAGVIDRAAWVWVRAGRAGIAAALASGDAQQGLQAAAGLSAAVTGDGAHPFDVDLARVDADLAAGELAEAWARAERLLADRRSAHDRVGEGEVTVRVARLAVERERFAAAIRLAQQAVSLAQHAGGIIAQARLVEASAASAMGQRSAAASALHAALVIATAGGLVGVAREVLRGLIALAEHAEPRRAAAWRAALDAGGRELWAKVEQADGWARARRS